MVEGAAARPHGPSPNPHHKLALLTRARVMRAPRLCLLPLVLILNKTQVESPVPGPAGPGVRVSACAPRGVTYQYTRTVAANVGPGVSCGLALA